MVRVAAISDIHGNLDLLKIVWQKLYKLGLTPDQSGLPILNAGDNVVYGAQNNECVDFLRDKSNNVITVGGNYDRNIAHYKEKEASFIKRWQRTRPDKFEAIQRANEEVTDKNRQWLASLPRFVEVEIGGANFLVTHYRPGDDKLSLFGFTPQSEFEAIAADLDGGVQVVVTGHTHRQFVKTVDGVLFVNPGSVGRPLAMPTFAVIEIASSGRLSAEIVKCYDSQP
jgi:putative phosphoesterase